MQCVYSWDVEGKGSEEIFGNGAAGCLPLGLSSCAALRWGLRSSVSPLHFPRSTPWLGLDPSPFVPLSQQDGASRELCKFQLHHGLSNIHENFNLVYLCRAAQENMVHLAVNTNTQGSFLSTKFQANILHINIYFLRCYLAQSWPFFY